MKLNWIRGTGPATTQELADLVEQEGRLGKGSYVTKDGCRCLWGVIEDHTVYSWPTFRKGRALSGVSYHSLSQFHCTTADNDGFLGTPEERCVEFVCRLRAIP